MTFSMVLSPVCGSIKACTCACTCGWMRKPYVELSAKLYISMSSICSSPCSNEVSEAPGSKMLRTNMIISTLMANFTPICSDCFALMFAMLLLFWSSSTQALRSLALMSESLNTMSLKTSYVTFSSNSVWLEGKASEVWLLPCIDESGSSWEAVCLPSLSNLGVTLEAHDFSVFSSSCSNDWRSRVIRMTASLQGMFPVASKSRRMKTLRKCLSKAQSTYFCFIRRPAQPSVSRGIKDATRTIRVRRCKRVNFVERDAIRRILESLEDLPAAKAFEVIMCCIMYVSGSSARRATTSSQKKALKRYSLVPTLWKITSIRKQKKTTVETILSWCWDSILPSHKSKSGTNSV
mmetsp:Transcript_57976/g.161790  ORF Transcript_57976/g.161790 Transcript_57976/m.161790 type:complete len:349 (-) Transcript_57976:564-1610(-)